MQRDTTSRTIAWGVLFTLIWAMAVGFWGSFYLNLSSVAVVAARSQDHDAEAEHKRLCHCLNCPGGKQCCCLAARDTNSRVVLQAQCDTGPTAHAPLLAVIALVPRPAAVYVPVLVPACVLLHGATLPPPLSRTPAPPSLPPLSLS